MIKYKIFFIVQAKTFNFLVQKHTRLWFLILVKREYLRKNAFTLHYTLKTCTGKKRLCGVTRSAFAWRREIVMGSMLSPHRVKTLKDVPTAAISDFRL